MGLSLASDSVVVVNLLVSDGGRVGGGGDEDDGLGVEGCTGSNLIRRYGCGR